MSYSCLLISLNNMNIMCNCKSTSPSTSNKSNVCVCVCVSAYRNTKVCPSGVHLVGANTHSILCRFRADEHHIGSEATDSCTSAVTVSLHIIIIIIHYSNLSAQLNIPLPRTDTLSQCATCFQSSGKTVSSTGFTAQHTFITTWQPN